MDSIKKISKEKMISICILGRFFAFFIQAASFTFLMILKNINFFEFIVFNVIILIIEIIITL
jgi:hypothetical protein